MKKKKRNIAQVRSGCILKMLYIGRLKNLSQWIPEDHIIFQFNL